MRLSTRAVALLPSLAAAVNIQITKWACTTIIDPVESIEFDSVRDFGESGCAGWRLTPSETNENWLQGPFNGNPDRSDAFGFGEVPEEPGTFRYTAIFPDRFETGTCVEADADFESCQEGTACSIIATHDCTPE